MAAVDSHGPDANCLLFAFETRRQIKKAETLRPLDFGFHPLRVKQFLPEHLVTATYSNNGDMCPMTPVNVCRKTRQPQIGKWSAIVLFGAGAIGQNVRERIADIGDMCKKSQ